MLKSKAASNMDLSLSRQKLSSKSKSSFNLSNRNFQSTKSLASQSSFILEESDYIDHVFEKGKTEIEKIEMLLIEWLNSHFQPIGIEIKNIKDDIQGFHLLVIFGCVMNFFIPPSNFAFQSKSSSEKLDNINYFIKIMEEFGIKTDKWDADKLLEGDLKTMLKVLYFIHHIEITVFE